MIITVTPASPIYALPLKTNGKKQGQSKKIKKIVLPITGFVMDIRY